MSYNTTENRKQRKIMCGPDRPSKKRTIITSLGAGLLDSSLFSTHLVETLPTDIVTIRSQVSVDARNKNGVDLPSSGGILLPQPLKACCSV